MNMGFRVGVVACVGFLAAQAGVRPAAAETLPRLGLGIRSNSQECIDHFRGAHALLSSYFKGVPPLSGVERIDVLTGGILAPNALSTLEVGKPYRTRNLSLSSSYRSTDDSLIGELRISTFPGAAGTLSVYVTIEANIGGGTVVYLSLTASSCRAGVKASSAEIGLRKGVMPGSLSEPYCSFGVLAGNISMMGYMASTDCKDGSKTLADLLAAGTVTIPPLNYPTGHAKAGQAIDYAIVDTPSERTAFLAGMTNYDLLYSSGQPSLKCQIAGFPYSDYIDTMGMSAAAARAEKNRNVLEYYAGLKAREAASGQYISAVSSGGFIRAMGMSELCNR